MYKCEDLQIGDGVIKADYGIEYVGIRAFLEDQQCKVHCLVMEDCNILKAFDKFEKAKEIEREKEALRKKLKII